jgi:hypothetical protein
VVLGPIVCSVGGSWVPEKTELVLGFAASKPMESHIHGFVHRGCMLLFTTPRAVLLSVCMGVGGCLWPISASVWHCGTALRALM